jgi:hypothetical protein
MSNKAGEVFFDELSNIPVFIPLEMPVVTENDDYAFIYFFAGIIKYHDDLKK